MGSYYSPFLAEQCNNGVVGVPSMVANADSAGILEDFSTENLEKAMLLFMAIMTMW